MDLEVFVQEARLWNHNPVQQPVLLIRKLRAEKAETIIHFYEQVQGHTAATAGPALPAERTPCRN